MLDQKSWCYPTELSKQDPDGGSKIIDGVVPDRRISITDSDMRHGRKSSSRTINRFIPKIFENACIVQKMGSCYAP